jgi:hypothetical protein
MTTTTCARSDSDGSDGELDAIVHHPIGNCEMTKRHIKHKVWVIGFDFDETGVRVLLVQDISGDIAPVGGSVIDSSLGMVRGQPVDLVKLEASMCENANREAFEEIGLTDLFDVSSNTRTTLHRFSWLDPATPEYEYHCRVYYIDISRQMRELTPDHANDMRACERHVMHESDISANRHAHEVLGAKFYTLAEIWAMKQNKGTVRLWFALSRLFDKPSCRRFFAEKLPKFKSTRAMSATWPTVPWECTAAAPTTKRIDRWVDATAPKMWVDAAKPRFAPATTWCTSRDDSWVNVVPTRRRNWTPRGGIHNPYN